MWGLMCTLYYTLENAINRKVLRMVDDTDNDIRFNPTQEATWSRQFFIEKLQTTFSDYYSHPTTLSWPVLVWIIFLWLGTLSTAARMLRFIVTCKPARGLARFIVLCVSVVLQTLLKPIKSSDWYQKKHIIPPRFHSGDNIFGWINTFERHTQDIS